MAAKKTMKQSTSTFSPASSTSFVDEELEVCHILLSLPNLIRQFDRSPFTWGATRRRSAVDSKSSASWPPPLPRPCHGETETETETEARPQAKVEAMSPATPLSFSPSESDEKSKPPLKKISKKRTREEWLEIIDGLTQRRELLRGELNTVTSYHKRLMAENLELKAKKQELSHLETIRGFSSVGMELRSQPELQSGLVVSRDHQPQIHMILHQRRFPLDRTASGSQASEIFRYPCSQIPGFLACSSGLGMVNRVGPQGIPDLNVAAEETCMMDASQPLDHGRAFADKRARAAQARRRRMIKEMQFFPEKKKEFP
ncbi:uncharacterized protein LOC127808309 isoform X2 [Diospyros lotus]|uniref:uncharacterized protein LOC127808309 isoform X2 n=1 Tax=Diospyros lotus TaxID=55363 RepID=UPI00225BC05E|nr:uncharacterized protein LOC127808309 isoform X2 [Diospyros lotus]